MNKIVFVLIHLSALLVFFAGYSHFALGLCIFFYALRMFAITAGFHRLLSHRSYSTSRFFQFLISFIGTTAAQKGPLWWAALHRHHHKHSDTEHDIHSPLMKGIWYAHAGWVLSKDNDEADLKLVKDISHPELLWLDKYHFLPPLMFIAFLIPFGWFIETFLPGLNTTMFQVLAWGGFLSTVLLYHGTFAINSVAHIFGKRRFETTDHSRNSLTLALITLGEGWHNNHHRYPGSERQGFYWWEIDISHYILVILSKFGIVWNLRTPSKRIYDEAKQNNKAVYNT